MRTQSKFTDKNEAEIHLITENGICNKLVTRVILIVVSTIPFFTASAQFSNRLNDSLFYYINEGDFDKAAVFGIMAESIAQLEYGVGSEIHITSLNNLASIYQEVGKFHLSDSLFQIAISMSLDNFGKSHSSYLYSANNRAALLIELGDISTAEELYTSILPEIRATFGDSSLEYSSALNNLALALNDLGEYSKSLDLHLLSLDIAKVAVGTKHKEYATGLHNLAEFYGSIGAYSRALPYAKKSLKIYKDTFGQNHPYYAMLLNGIGTLYWRMGKYDSALSMNLLSMRILEGKKLIFTPPSYVTKLNDLALVYRSLEDYDKALSTALKALENIERSLGKNHSEYFKALYNTGLIYMSMEDFPMALYYFTTSLDGIEKYYGDRYPGYHKLLSNISVLFELTNQNSKSYGWSTKSLEVSLKHLEALLAGLQEKDKITCINRHVLHFDRWRSLSYLHFEDLHVNSAFAHEMTIRKVALEQFARTIAVLYRTGNQRTKNLLIEWRNLALIINREHSKPSHLRNTKLDSLKRRFDDLEIRMAMLSKEFSELKAVFHFEISNLLNNISQHSCYIAISQFRLWNKHWSDTIQYVAYIVLPGDTNVKMVHLGTQYDFATKKALPLYDSRNLTAVRTPDPEGANLLKAVYSLKPNLKGIDTIYFSPSGIFNQVNVAALTLPDSSRLWDSFHIEIKSSVRELLNESEVSSSQRNLLLFGGLRFTDDYPAANDSVDCFNPVQEVMNSISGRGRHRAGNGIWTPLGWSTNEVLEIQEIAKSKDLQAEVLIDSGGSEARFKALDGQSPYVLHLATHGYFFENPEVQKLGKPDPSNAYGTPFRLTDDPMMRSGLVLSGANRAWRHGCNPFEPEDGILTAREISHMDLSQTELVVLSACQTGLGDIDNSEGVYGLQRAFKMAGVNYIIMSLWNVPDQQTSELMIAFYRNWLEKEMPLSEAFYAAQKKMAADYPKKPELWAGFVLMQ